MTVRASILLLLVTALCASPTALHGQNAEERDGVVPEYEAAFAVLRTLADSSGHEAASVANLQVALPAGGLSLGAGQAVRLDLPGGLEGFAFDGEGRFQLNPPNDVERHQLERFFDVPALDTPIRRAVLFTSPGQTPAGLDALSWTPAELRDGPKDVVEQAFEYLLREDEEQADAGWMAALLNGTPHAYVYLHIHPEDGDPLVYRFDAGQREAVSFGRRARARGPRRFETISQFAHAEPVSRNFQWLDGVAYDASVHLDDGLDFSAEVLLHAVPNVGGGAWIPFRLFSELEVESVRWDDQPTPFHRGDESGQVWVRQPDGTQAGHPVVLSFEYAGDLIDRSRIGWWYLKTATGWYPRTGEIDATFNLRYTVPSDYEFSSAGRLVSREQDGDVTRWAYAVERPAPHATFNVGNFEDHQLGDERGHPIRLQWARSAHNQITGLLQQDDVAGQVGGDVANALVFFTDRFGPLPVDTFQVTEIPAFHGQAFPGMIELSWVTFQWTGRDGHDEIFRAHEVAHQWWGLGVRPDTYRDVWLSEGLSEFSGLWFMQRVLMDNGKYFDRLEDAQRNIFKRRGKAGPIWLGPRLYTEDTESDYQTIVYEKGAWVIHMLRNLLIDLDSMSEDVFRSLLSEVYATYQNRSMSTEQFRTVVERHAGTDMGWFFDQWVYGTDLPEYRWATRGEATPEGGWKVTMRVEQRGVPDDFLMVVPVFLDFGDDGTALVRTVITGGVAEFELPIMPREPDAIEFNALQSVLAEVDEVDWDDIGR